MGCCQSDLKGEQPTGTAAEAPQPMKKVATNFSTVDYDSGAKNRRETHYAPHEEATQVNELPTVAESAVPSTPPAADRSKSTVSPKTSRVPEGGEAPVQPPYKDIDDQDPSSPTQVNPIATAVHPTPAAPEITSPPSDSHDTADMGLFSKSKKSTEQAASNGTDVVGADNSDNKMEFSNSIDTTGSEDVSSGQVKDKKSLYRKFSDLKRGPGVSGMSDEDYLKYTGKTRAEFDEWKKKTPGVAGNQAAGSLLAGGTSGIGVAGGGGEGLGGWGRSESTRRPDVS